MGGCVRFMWAVGLGDWVAGCVHDFDTDVTVYWGILFAIHWMKIGNQIGRIHYSIFSM